MSRTSPARRALSRFTLFGRLLALRDRLADLFRADRPAPVPNARLSVEAMEERLVPDGRPLPNPVIYAGAGVGHAPVVKAYNAETGALNFATLAYEASFQGGVRVATADFTGDGFPDVAAAPGPGHAPRVKVYDGISGDLVTGPVANFLAFGPGVTGGVYVAAADVDGDGTPDVVASAVTATGTRVRAFSGADGSVVADFLVAGPRFADGATVAAADLTGDGKAEVVVGAVGPTGQGWVRTYDPLTGTLIAGPLGNFRAFGTGYGGGVFVGADSLAGDIDADGTLDLVVGTASGLARVRAFGGADGSVLHDFLPFGGGVNGGARVALAYVTDDEFADLVVGTGPGTPNKVRVFDGLTGGQLAAPVGQYTPFGSSPGGVFVAASNDPLGGVTTLYANGGTGNLTLAAGQVITLYATVAGVGSNTPTGTVEFSVTDASTTIWSSTQSLATTTAPTAATPTLTVALPAGTYQIVAAYSGGAGTPSGSYGPSVTFLDATASAGSGPPPLAPAGGSCVCDGPVADPGGSGKGTQGGVSATGVNALGLVQLARSDLSSGGYGLGWGQDWAWTNGSGYADGLSGSGATQSQAPHLVQANGNDSLAVVANGKTATFFDSYSGAYHARFGSAATITHDTTNHWFVVTDGTGRVFTFYDFSGSTPTGRAGKLKTATDAAGGVTEVTSWDGSGRPTEVQRVSGTGGGALTESFLSTYVASGTNAGLLETVTWRTKVGTGAWTTVRSTAYTYYDGVTGPGLAGALKTAVVKDASGATIDTSYYRYYTSGTGSSGKVKYEFGPAAYARLTTALGTGVDSLTDGQVDDYADTYLGYDSSGRVTTLVKAGAGCSACSGGLGTYTYSYATNGSAGLLLPNEWKYKVAETRPDGSTSTSYTNGFGQVMLSVFDDAGSVGLWRTYTRYDDAGRVVLTAGPSTVTGYSESNLDLVGYSGGNASYLDDDDGVVTAYTYGSATTATSSTAGDAAGFVKQVDIQRGETGTAVPQQAFTYLKRTAGGVDTFVAAAVTAYRNDDGTGGQTTSFAYTWQGSTAQPESVTTTLPAVTTAQNGSNSATSAVTVFDSFGRPVWSKDPGGFISYVQYDTVTGAVTKTIADVNTANTGDFANLPSGWSGGGEHLITTFEVDGLGRVTKTTSPEGRIDYTVYNDAAHEVRHYSGWDTTNNVPTGPITVSRTDQANGYTESLAMSATAAVSGNRPTGTESVAKVQSLSRSYVNAVGQVTQSDSYFDLAGLTYSTSTSLGTSGVNFYRTQYAYDSHGLLNKTTSPEGTIYRTVYDDMGRAKSEWVGTDDTPTSGNWSPTNLTGTNTVKVREYEYDGGSVGDGNRTKVTEYPGGGATARVTQTWYDWRNRPVAVKQGVEGSESTSVNRPLVYSDYDNLGQVTKTRVYDADTVTPSVTSGVPQPLSSGLLRGQSTASFDELGRAYRTEVYSVDPSTGSVSSDTLETNTWFDSRGNVLKTASPGGLVAKYVYDGAGRATTSYLSDGGGDSGYSDADDVTGDTVLEQSETTFSDDGLVLSTLSRVRFHDASGTGALGSPSSGIGARVSYMGSYYDTYSGRTTATVDVGTNGGSAWTRPGSVPSRSDTVLVTGYGYAADAVQVVKLTGSPTGGTFTLTFGGQTTLGIAYNASAATVDSAVEALSSVGGGNAVVTAAAGGGWQVRFSGTLAGKYQAKMTASGAGLTGGSSPSVAVTTLSQGGDTGAVAEVTDPEALVSRTYADALGRTTQGAENFTDGAFSDTANKTTQFAYNSAGMTSLTAVLTGGGVQTTQWVYGVTQSGSGLDSNDIVGATRWPDPSTGAASGSEQETTTVNALGQTLTATDRNGSVHTLTYDVLGRVTIDAVTTLGSGVDGSVRRVEYAYDGRGNAYLITSYDAASSGNIVNQVQREFNGLGQLTKEWQAHSGAVNTSTSPKVQYAYSEMPSGANHSRLTSVTYPSGYVLTFNYASGLNSDISRLSSLSDSGGTLESYDYLGLSTVVRRVHTQPGVDLTYIKQSGESNGDAGDQYTGLDRFGRVVDQRWIKTSGPTTTDRFGYGYDRDSNRLWRDNMVNAAFGELYAYDDLNQITSFDRGTLNGTKTGLTGSASRSQDWDFDALGNWDSVVTDAGTQTRTHNAQNEVTAVSGATTPTFDANGNMTQAETGLRYVYDAWNRLVTVKNSGGTTLKTYTYDGLGRRVTETASGTTTNLFYSDQWQVLEEKVSSNTTKRYVWSPVYVDAMILRDRDTDANGTLDERLWVQQDANFNVTALVNGSGSVVERYAYDPFGVRTVYDSSYAVRSGGSNYDLQHGFQGLRHDSTSGLDEANRRWYSPSLGRWVSVDPITFNGGDRNLYGFVGNSPLNASDPSGLQRMVPKLDIKPLSPPVVGAYGAFVYPVQFVLDKPAGGDGWIIQQLEIRYKYTDKNGVDVTNKIRPVARYNYWEAWAVNKGATAPREFFWGRAEREALATGLAGEADLLKKLGFGDDQAYKNAIQASKDIQAGNWNGAHDIYMNVGVSPANCDYATGEVTFNGLVYFVQDPDLPASFLRPGAPGATWLNENPSGVLRNLSIIGLDREGYDKTKEMLDWIGSTSDKGLVSNKIIRKVVATWSTTGPGIITKVDVTGK